jgi:predicted dehydrogenase
MAEQAKLAFIAAGKRALTWMAQLYELRTQNYFLCERHEESDFGFPHGTVADDFPHDIYAEYGDHDRIPEWVEDISDLQPEVTAIVDPSEEARREGYRVCSERGDDPELFASLDELLAYDDFNAAFVTSPNDTHVDAIVPLLEHDVDTYSEKPIATTLEDHDRIADAHRNSSAIFYPGFNARMQGLNQELKRRFDDGAIGDIGMLSHTAVRDPFHRAKAGSGAYRFSQERSGGALLEKNCHDFDLFNWFTGRDPVSVSAFGGQFVFSRNTDIVDQATVNVQYEGGVVASLELCLYNNVGQRHMHEYRGSSGVVQTAEDGGVWLLTKGNRERIEAERTGPHGGADIRMMKRYLRTLQGEAEPHATLEDAKKADAIALAAEKSIANDGEPIALDSEYDF